MKQLQRIIVLGSGYGSIRRSRTAAAAQALHDIQGKFDNGEPLPAAKTRQLFALKG